MALPDADRRRRTARGLRGQVPRSSHALWQPSPDRRSPTSILDEQERDRVQDLLPIRHERMTASAFAFLRGAAAVMAEDLAGTPTSGLRVQACGDAHLLNFGIFATPERRLVFELNDFDETLPAPFEWDIKRLAASVVVAGRVQGFSPEAVERAARSAATAYRTHMLESATLSHLDVWYARLEVEDLMGLFTKVERRRLASGPLRKAQQATSLGAMRKLTAVVDSELRIIGRSWAWAASAPTTRSSCCLAIPRATPSFSRSRKLRARFWKHSPAGACSPIMASGSSWASG